MTMLRRCQLPFVVLLSASIPLLSSGEEALLQISSSTAEITIKSRTDDRRSLKLPGLEYTFSIDARCDDGQSAQSMLLSIADTRKRLSGNELESGMATGVTLKIPSAQIAPLLLQGFCLNREQSEQDRSERITVYGALSAQAALLCADDNSEQMIYASQALDLTLHCTKRAKP